MKAIIIAAGLGSRLWPITQQMPKTLLPFGESTILDCIMSNFASIGISEFTVVVGFRGDLIREHLKTRTDPAHSITVLENEEWERGNGLSVLKARPTLGAGASAFLSMSDHLVHPDGLLAMKNWPENQSLLLTDPRVDEIQDIDDATKVRQENHRILDIGKQLTDYNAVDCGIFRVNDPFMTALQEAVDSGEESISAGVRRLIMAGQFGTVDHPRREGWIDIDTPLAYEFARRHAGSFAPSLRDVDPVVRPPLPAGEGS